MEGNAQPSSAAGSQVRLHRPAILLFRAWPARAVLQAWAMAVGVCAISAGFLAIVQFSTPGIVGNEGYYHIKLATLMRA